jgi:antitoxin VapB
MALSIKSREADQLARELAALTGEPITIVVLTALRARLEQERRKRDDKEARYERIMEIVRHSASLPILDTRSEDEILGYDENGIPS